MAGEPCESLPTIRKRTLIVKLPGTFEDDLVILHCEVSSEDPMSQFEHIEVTGLLTFGHLTVAEARKEFVQLYSDTDKEASQLL